MSDLANTIMLNEAFQAALQRYAHGNGSSASIARAAATDATAAIQAARNEAEAMRADAARYLAFFSAGLPITFLGQSYETKEELDAAIDAMKGDAHA